MKRVIMLVIVTISAFFLDSKQVTIGDCLSHALQHAPGLRVLRLEVENRKLEASMQLRDLLPRVSISAFFNPTGFSRERSSFGTRLDIEMDGVNPVILLMKRKGVRNSNNLAESIIRLFEVTFCHRVGNIYFNILDNQVRCSHLVRELKVLQELSMVDAAAGSNSAYLRTEQIRLELDSLRLEADLEKRELAELIGMDAAIELLPIQDDTAWMPIDIESRLAKLFGFRESIVKSSVKENSLARYPQPYIRLGFPVGKREIRFPEQLNYGEDQWYAVLGLKWAVFDGGRRALALKKALIHKEHENLLQAITNQKYRAYQDQINKRVRFSQELERKLDKLMKTLQAGCLMSGTSGSQILELNLEKIRLELKMELNRIDMLRMNFNKVYISDDLLARMLN